MANKTIPDLIEVTSPNTTDFLVIQNSGTTKKIQLLNIVPSSSITSSKLANASVTNNKLATVGAYTIKGRNENTPGSPEDLTANQVKDMLGIPSTPLLTAVNVLSSDTLNLYWDSPTTTLSGNVNTQNLITYLPFELSLNVTNETTILTTGTSKMTFRMPRSITLNMVKASLNTASTLGDVQVDINKNGSSILSTKLTIDVSEKTSTTAVVSAVISDQNLPDDSEITVDIDSAGTNAVGLKVWLLGTRN